MTAEIPQTPEALMDLPWEVVKPEKVQQIRDFASGRGLVLPAEMKVFQGGSILKPDEGVVENENDRSYLENGRPIAVLPVKSSKDQIEYDRVLHIPTNTEKISPESRFDANLASYRNIFARFVAKKIWRTPDSLNPIPVAIETHEVPDKKHVAVYAIVTELRKGIEGLGKGGPDSGMHQLDIQKLPLEEIPRLLNMLDAIHVSSDQFRTWVDSNGIYIPSASWLSPNNPRCALRGQEWWINPDSTKDDRWKELTRLAELNPPNEGTDRFADLRNLYHAYFPENDFPDLLKNMIQSNLALYPHQDGTVDEADRDLVGETVVVHGVLNPNNIHKKLNPLTGSIDYTITGGDRAQLYGLRGQTVDWLVAASAASPDHQNRLLDEFLKLQKRRGRDYDKELRGLAMHVMYRSISEAHYFAEQGKMAEAENLVKLASEIVKGQGRWKGVNNPMKDLSRDLNDD